MRPLDAHRRLLHLALCLLLVTPALGRADAPSTPPTVQPGVATPTIEDKARRGLDLELDRNWAAAIEVYEELLKENPGRTDFRGRLRLCEAHYKLNRRYNDASFRTVLLRLSSDKVFELYDELIERIQSHYVETVAVEPLLRRGLDNLEVAFRDPSFLRSNAPGADPERVKRLRDRFRQQRGQIGARTRDDARVFLVWACDQARAELNVGAPAIVLEFAFGACDALDDYTTYLTPDKLDDLFGLIDGNFVGLGVELKADPLGLRLVNVLKGGPAFDGGLKPGDRITHVDGLSLKGQGLDEAAGRLQGNEGSVTELTIINREGASRRVRMTRRPVEVRSVSESRIVDQTEGVGYVQLVGFQKNSTEELRQAILSLEKQGMRYLVLDLRGNPGGLLNVAVEIADFFLDSGVIVSTRGRASNQSAVYRANPGAPWRMPVSILVDHDSASASEILAGALKENRRALVIGERSYGKGSVQSIFPLRTAPAGLKLTTAKFYSPLDRAYSERGVEPDLSVSSRLSAKPVGTEAPIVEFGDPARDPVLESAIKQARRQLSAVQR